MKSEDAFRLLKSIICDCKDQVIVVVSAMGKTTNNLEEIVKLAFKENDLYKEKLQASLDYHLGIIKQLLNGDADELSTEIQNLFEHIESQINQYKGAEFNFFYDQIVTMGEILSTRIVSYYLNEKGMSNTWVDIRKCMRTNSNFRDAAVDLQISQDKVRQVFNFKSSSCYITQGFIGSDPDGHSTSLGREGSDYTAALLANMLNANHVILWKDVAGIFNADPAVFSEAVLLKKVRYQEMIELAFYGAKVIHPKTIKPLREKEIPLFVKCFFHSEGAGTQVGNYEDLPRPVPNIILKNDQVLISISMGDLSFITEKHLSKLFNLLNRFRLKANMMQHSAVSFSVCVDEPRGREVKDLIEILRKEFKVLYNDKLTLYTIRHYDEDAINSLTTDQKIFVEQRSRNTVQYLMG